MVSSLIAGGSFARQSTTLISASSSAATARAHRILNSVFCILNSACSLLIFTRHCTPVQAVEERPVLAPAGLHLHMQIEIDLDAEQLFHLRARQRPDLLQHRRTTPDHDSLLPLALHADGRVNARDLRRFLPTLHCHR